tara:strand:- start:21286 stop:22131 length:846 start_codon:yes stop_codon:yes gene_type:complete
MATLASALLARDMSVEQAQEQQALNDYYRRISENSWMDALLGFGGKALGTMIGGPAGGFLLGQLGKYGSRAARGGFEGPPELSGGKFYRQDMKNTLTDIKNQQSLFNASMLMDMGADALTAFNTAGGIQGVRDEGWGTLMTRGTGPGAKAGWLGTTKRAGGSGIGFGGWKGMQLDPTQFESKAGDVPENLTAGDVYERDPYKYRQMKIDLKDKQGKITGAKFTPPGVKTVAGPRKAAFWQYQMGLVPETSDYTRIAQNQMSVDDILKQFYNQSVYSTGTSK